MVSEIDLTIQDEVNCSTSACKVLSKIGFKGSGIASMTLCGQVSSFIGGIGLEAVYVILERWKYFGISVNGLYRMMSFWVSK